MRKYRKGDIVFDLSADLAGSDHSNIMESATEQARKAGLSDREAKILATRTALHIANLKGAGDESVDAFREAVGVDAFNFVARKFREDFTPANVGSYPVGVLVFLKSMLAANYMSSQFTFGSIEGPEYRINSQDGKLSEQIDFGDGDTDVYPETLGLVTGYDNDDEEVVGEAWFGADEYDAMPAGAFDASQGIELEFGTETGEVDWYAISLRNSLQAEKIAEALYIDGVANEASNYAAELTALFAYSRCLSTALSSAGIVKTWSRTMPAGSVYELLDPRAWNMTLFDLVGSMPLEVRRWKDAPEPLSWVCCSPTTMTSVYKLAPQSRSGFSTFMGGTDAAQRGSGKFGVNDQRGGTATPEMEVKSYSTEILTDDVLLFGPDPVNDPSRAPLLHVEFMSVSMLGELVDPVTRERKRGWMSANKDVPLRVNNLAKITLTD